MLCLPAVWKGCLTGARPCQHNRVCRVLTTNSMNGDAASGGMGQQRKRWPSPVSFTPAAGVNQQQPFTSTLDFSAIPAPPYNNAAVQSTYISDAELLLARQTSPVAIAAATAQAAQAGQSSRLHVHVPFAALFSYLTFLGVFATSTDWYLDIACFGGLWACLWAACCSLQPSPRTVVLLNLLPVTHMAGALGAYHWELGNLSWDIIVHTSNGFIGTLLFAACLSDMAAAAAAAAGADTELAGQDGGAGCPEQQHQAGQAGRGHSWQHKAWGVLQLSALLIAGTSLVEVLEAYGGQVAGSGEGIFLRGAGDFCTASLPCGEDVDTAKDMVDNIVGMSLALVALGTGKSSHSKV